MSVKWITHKGKQILYSDFSGLTGQAYIDAIKSGVEMMDKAPGKVLNLLNVTGAVVDTTAMTYSKSLGEAIEEKTEKRAIVGVTGLKNWLAASYNWITGAGDHQKFFDTLDEAKEWLVE